MIKDDEIIGEIIAVTTTINQKIQSVKQKKSILHLSFY